MIHVDFSENFKNKQQNIRVLWSRSIHYFHNGGLYKGRRKCCCKNYALVTPENDHSCNISFGLNNFMISHICLDYDIHTLKCWSDGCSAANMLSICSPDLIQQSMFTGTILKRTMGKVL